MNDDGLIAKLMSGNRRWADETKQRDPEFFARLSGGQAPICLLIGCSDSRVPVSQVLGLGPGDVFVHRNIGNVVPQTDLNCLSVIQFAIEVLQIQHIVVCGHYGCAAVAAAVEDQRHGFVDNWLNGIRAVLEPVQEKINAMADDRERHDSACEINVLGQVYNVCRTSPVRDAWERGLEVAVHGLIYSIRDGLLRDLHVHVTGPSEVTTLTERLRS